MSTEPNSIQRQPVWDVGILTTPGWYILGAFASFPSETNLYRLQICVRCRVSEDSQHGDDLSFVVKRVGYHVEQDKSRTPEFATPIHGTRGKSRVKLLFRETIQISSSCFPYPVFGSQQGCHCRTICFVPTGKSFVLQVVDPAFLAGQDVHKLLPD